MTTGALLIILLVILVIGAAPQWRYSEGWGYTPSGLLGAILVVVIILVALGRL